MLRARASVAIAALALMPPAPRSAERIDVPRGGAVVIDGQMDDAEWQHAAVRRLSDGTVLRFQRDRRYLFLGVRAPRRGYPSVCIANGDTVRIFHASAALGSVTYTRTAGGWVTRDKEFVYGMRNTSLDVAAREERATYLRDHGWVASTARMGGGRTHELQVALDVVGRLSTLGLAYFVSDAGDTNTIVAWPEAPAPRDGCADDQLVRGYVPQRLRFDPRGWAAIAFTP